MPYVEKDIREQISYWNKAPGTVGELTYKITEVVMDYLVPDLATTPSFSDLSEAIAALECAKLELYRRVVAPYEDKKCEENGDVY